MHKLFALSLIALSLVAADKPKDPPKPTPISAEARAAYWRALNDFRAANDSVRTAQDNLKEAVAALTKECKGKNPVPDAKGEPQCPAEPPAK